VSSNADITVPISIGKAEHFPAWEMPLRFAEQLRTAFRPMRKSFFAPSDYRKATR
jgi:hypothetical protein